MLGVLLEHPRSQIDGDHGVNVTRWDAKSGLAFSDQIRLGLPLVQLEVQSQIAADDTHTGELHKSQEPL